MIKRWIILTIAACLLRPVATQAQIPIVDVLKTAVKKVIRAIDLQVQKQQNKVIWMQNAQKAIENAMAKTKLNEISEWTDKQRKLYDDYYRELAKVKAIISTYSRVKDMILRQKQLVQEYGQTWSLIRQDKNFTASELTQIYGVYSGIIDESLKNMEQMELVVSSFSTTMSDGRRMELIKTAADGIDRNLADLRRFNTLNAGISTARAKALKNTQTLKQLYGSPKK